MFDEKAYGSGSLQDTPETPVSQCLRREVASGRGLTGEMTIERPENERYTHGYHEAIVSTYARRTAEECAAFLLPHLRVDAVGLDMGSGPGTITAGLGPTGRAGDRPGRFRGDGGCGSQPGEGPRDRPMRPSGSVLPTTSPGGTATSTWSTPTSCSSISPNPSGHCGKPAGSSRPGGLLAVRDADYGSMAFFPTESGSRPVARVVSPGDGGQRGRGRRGALRCCPGS